MRYVIIGNKGAYNFEHNRCQHKFPRKSFLHEYATMDPSPASASDVTKIKCPYCALSNARDSQEREKHAKRIAFALVETAYKKVGVNPEELEFVSEFESAKKKKREEQYRFKGLANDEIMNILKYLTPREIMNFFMQDVETYKQLGLDLGNKIKRLMFDEVIAQVFPMVDHSKSFGEQEKEINGVLDQIITKIKRRHPEEEGDPVLALFMEVRPPPFPPFNVPVDPEAQELYDEYNNIKKVIDNEMQSLRLKYRVRHFFSFVRIMRFFEIAYTTRTEDPAGYGLWEHIAGKFVLIDNKYKGSQDYVLVRGKIRGMEYKPLKFDSPVLKANFLGLLAYTLATPELFLKEYGKIPIFYWPDHTPNDEDIKKAISVYSSTGIYIEYDEMDYPLERKNKVPVYFSILHALAATGFQSNDNQKRWNALWGDLTATMSTNSRVLYFYAMADAYESSPDKYDIYLNGLWKVVEKDWKDPTTELRMMNIYFLIPRTYLFSTSPVRITNYDYTLNYLLFHKMESKKFGIPIHMHPLEYYGGHVNNQFMIVFDEFKKRYGKYAAEVKIPADRRPTVEENELMIKQVRYKEIINFYNDIKKNNKF